jgi:predicted DNA binding CopG/RHH family protein
MAIAKNPKRSQSAITDRKAEEFIAKRSDHEANGNKKPVIVRIESNLMERIDRAAKRLGISRSAFIVSSVAKEVERMEGLT